MKKDDIIRKLWSIIDDIDTFDDMAKEDNELYRSLVKQKQDERWELPIITNGYDVKINSED